MAIKTDEALAILEMIALKAQMDALKMHEQAADDATKQVLVIAAGHFNGVAQLLRTLMVGEASLTQEQTLDDEPTDLRH